MNHVEYHMAHSQAWHHTGMMVRCTAHVHVYVLCAIAWMEQAMSFDLSAAIQDMRQASSIDRWLGETLFGVDLHLCCNEDMGWQIIVSKVHVHVAWIHNRIWEWIDVYKPGKGACLFKAILSSNTLYWILLLYVNSLFQNYMRKGRAVVLGNISNTRQWTFQFIKRDGFT